MGYQVNLWIKNFDFLSYTAVTLNNLDNPVIKMSLKNHLEAMIEHFSSKNVWNHWVIKKFMSVTFNDFHIFMPFIVSLLLSNPFASLWRNETHVFDSISFISWSLQNDQIVVQVRYSIAYDESTIDFFYNFFINISQITFSAFWLTLLYLKCIFPIFFVTRRWSVSYQLRAWWIWKRKNLKFPHGFIKIHIKPTESLQIKVSTLWLIQLHFFWLINRWTQIFNDHFITSIIYITSSIICFDRFISQK